MYISQVLQSNSEVRSAFERVLPQIFCELYRYLIPNVVC